jgi:succinate dehydrogenase hydrophobic anchor subunit
LTENPTTSTSTDVNIPAPPRPITRNARRRSWIEGPVRVWLILAILVGVVTIFFATQQTLAALELRKLIDHGTLVDARVSDMSRGAWFQLEYELDGAKYTTEQTPMMLKRQEQLQRGQIVPIRVDPDHPRTWTDRERNELEPIHRELVAAVILVPLLVLTIVMTLLKRRQVLRVWRDAPLMQGIVIETKQSSMSPMSRVVRFTIGGAAGARIWSTLIPVKAGVPAKDEPIDLICPPSNPDHAIVAKLYV